MKNTIYVLFAFVGLISLSSCKEAFDYGSATNFKTESFNDFLWKKQPPVEIEAVINTEFAECEGLDKPLVLQLCDDDAKAITPKVAQLYVNGQKSDNNTISIDPKSKKKETEIKIVLDKSQTDETRTFSWNLQVVDNPGLVRINDRATGKDPWIADTQVYWKNQHVANSLEVAFWTVLATLLGIFILAIFLCRMNNPAFKVSKLFLTGDTMKTVTLRGAGKVVFSNVSKSQSFIKDIFFRKAVFVKNEFFSAGDVVVTPKFRIQTDSGRRNGVRISAKNYSIDSNVIAKDDSMDITNIDTQQVINIKIQ